MKTRIAKRKAACLASACLALSLAAGGWWAASAENGTGGGSVMPWMGPGTPPVGDCGAWIVDWDDEQGWRELREQPRLFRQIQWFAAGFDETGALKTPETLSRALAYAAKRKSDSRESFFDFGNDAGPEHFLTVVNDRPGQLKDPELVARLLNDPERRAGHLRELAALASSPGLAGIELDYEAVRAGDWPAYLSFVGELQAELARAGGKLRVVLEPKKEYFVLPFPKGPDYVLMAYNLFGGHGGPGPKANPEFLRTLGERCRAAGIAPRLALANGGFIWRPGSRAVTLTEVEALALARAEGVKPERDPDSAAMFFRYPANAPAEAAREVWYADGYTLAFWIQESIKAGFCRFALWRLGGNRPQTLARLRQALDGDP